MKPTLSIHFDAGPTFLMLRPRTAASLRVDARAPLSLPFTLMLCTYMDNEQAHGTPRAHR